MKPVCNSVSVCVPATSANLGSGFDVAGIALDYADSLVFTLNDTLDDSQDVRVIIHGEGEDTLPKDETHLVVRAFRKACEAFGLPHLRFTLEAHNRIPQARGMGSSASAIVSGVAAAWAFAHNGNLNKQAIFELAAAIEGHPDNVAPAVFGGLTTSWKNGDEFHTVRYGVSKQIRATIFVPNFTLSTQMARKALPEKVPYADAVFNVSRACLLPIAFGDFGDFGDSRDSANSCDFCVKTTLSRNDLLFTATQDAIHQPYRASLMQPTWYLVKALRDKGFAAAISGAGSCAAVFYEEKSQATVDENNATNISEKIEKIAEPLLNGCDWKVLHVHVDSIGVAITRE
ncbi:homoserine kinase [Gardnerella vaginalis]|uniref:Homoserine kinase n=1 Tax=Gardnerella vaginalis (strain ATCC 14019 / 317) TaxID=525284 RepID=E3D8K4_GARV3|nr:homoserine kinase [Gardnerella vaginalis]ADP38398.1 homoserine kinase [Gardnerella vaginalis ATCC 14019]KOS08891.1 serine kinase [Gardnerella vaginalis]PNP86930.1 homoserine kinase [Gardnerella vaginalis]RFT25371.1 homoserine kinase [Gardnerella vaginalis]TCH79942.1 homoserine kinase [Gardnerella vaginalis]